MPTAKELATSTGFVSSKEAESKGIQKGTYVTSKGVFQVESYGTGYKVTRTSSVGTIAPTPTVYSPEKKDISTEEARAIRETATELKEKIPEEQQKQTQYVLEENRLRAVTPPSEPYLELVKVDKHLYTKAEAWRLVKEEGRKDILEKGKIVKVPKSQWTAGMQREYEESGTVTWGTKVRRPIPIRKTSVGRIYPEPKKEKVTPISIIPPSFTKFGTRTATLRETAPEILWKTLPSAYETRTVPSISYFLPETFQKGVVPKYVDITTEYKVYSPMLEATYGKPVEPTIGFGATQYLVKRFDYSMYPPMPETITYGAGGLTITAKRRPTTQWLGEYGIWLGQAFTIGAVGMVETVATAPVYPKKTAERFVKGIPVTIQRAKSPYTLPALTYEFLGAYAGLKTLTGVGGRVSLAVQKRVSSSYVPADKVGVKFTEGFTDPITKQKLISKYAGTRQTTIHATLSPEFRKFVTGAEKQVLLKGYPEMAKGFRKTYDLLHFYKSLPTAEGTPQVYTAYLGIGKMQSAQIQFVLIRPPKQIIIFPHEKISYIPPYKGETLMQYAIRTGKYSGKTMIPAENIFGYSFERQVVTPSAFKGKIDYTGSIIVGKEYLWTTYKEVPTGLAGRFPIIKQLLTKEHKIHVAFAETKPIGFDVKPSDIPVLDVKETSSYGVKYVSATEVSTPLLPTLSISIPSVPSRVSKPITSYSIPKSVSEIPSVPSRVSIPSVPSKPSIPSIPSMPVYPSTPSIPSKVSMPSAPSIPSIPSVPSKVSVPSIPSIPSKPSVPIVPTTPPPPTIVPPQYRIPRIISKPIKIEKFRFSTREFEDIIPKADVLSVDISKITFGRATHPKGRRVKRAFELETEIPITWRFPTAEMLKGKGKSGGMKFEIPKINIGGIKIEL